MNKDKLHFPKEPICPLSLLICQQKLNQSPYLPVVKTQESAPRDSKPTGDVSPHQPSVSELVILSDISLYVPLLK